MNLNKPGSVSDTDGSMFVRGEPDELLHYAVQSLKMVQDLICREMEDDEPMGQMGSFRDGVFFTIESIIESLKIAQDSYLIEIERLKEGSPERDTQAQQKPCC